MAARRKFHLRPERNRVEVEFLLFPSEFSIEGGAGDVNKDSAKKKLPSLAKQYSLHSRTQADGVGST